MDNNTVLRINHISKKYPGVLALDDVSFDIKKGQIHALMGENGAGKSTLIKVISGAIQPSGGSVIINDTEYKSLTPALSSQLGIGVIYQEFNNVPSLSVVENVFLGKKIGGRFCPDLKLMTRKAQEIFDKLGVSIPLDIQARRLSPAQQQIVEIARALSSDVKVLIMDEPSASLAMSEVERMLRIVRSLRDEGVTIIYISHRIDEVLDIADSLTVLRDGHHIETRPMKGIDRKEIIRLMVGRELNETYPSRSTDIGEPILQLENVSGNGVHDISFELRKGEILGLAGLIGAGRTELGKVIFGEARKDSGTIRYKGNPIEFHSAGQALSSGIGYISENRKEEGVFLNFPVDWNITISALKKYSDHGFVNKKALELLADKMVSRFKVKTPSQAQLVRNLSGGNQQKIALAKVLALDTDVIIFDEPTRGIDVGVKQEIYHLMNGLIENGVSIIMISSEMEELLGMSDRVVVLHEGRKMGEVDKKDFDQQKILTLASGIAVEDKE